MGNTTSREIIVKILSRDYCPNCGAEKGLVLRSGTPEHQRYVHCQECQFISTSNYYDGYYTWTLGERFK